MAEPKSPTLQSVLNLSKRDKEAVAYTKSALHDGDTLVFIRYPGGMTAYDSTGFPLLGKLRVHSSKLLATGSKIFANMLAPVLQARYRRTHHLQRDSDLPSGVQYVLDLTPPNEGDEAVEQISNLSCPQGILYWSTAASRCGISKDLIGGKDEVAKFIGQPVSSGSVHDNHPPAASLSSLSRWFDIDEDASTRADEDNHQDEHGEAVRDSENDQHRLEFPSGKKSETVDCANAAVAKMNGAEFPKEYCPIRHRAGIERILQIIEGKDPRIDSATKAWTVAVLSTVFDCTSVVVDSICTWILTQKNSLIIEILPEACLRLGQMLQSQLLTRAAFSILVSEEALAFAGQQDSQPSMTSNRAQATIFRRMRDAVDEDTLNMVQHAGRDFQARIDHQVRLLLDPSMTWLTTLPEHHKLQNLTRFLGDDRFDVKANELLRTIKNLEKALQHYVRGRLFSCTMKDLYHDQASIADSHRTSEHYMWGDVLKYKQAYDGLSSQERVLTRQLWEHIRSLTWTILATTNLIYDDLDPANPHATKKTNLEAARHFNIEKVWMRDLVYFADQFNKGIIRTISKSAYNGGIMPPEAFRNTTDFDTSQLPGGARTPDSPSSPQVSIKIENFGFDYDNSSLDEHARDEDSKELLQKFIDADEQRIPSIPAMHSISKDSPFFDLPEFLYQVGGHLSKLCDKMLSRGENSTFSLPETLLCLEDEEYKYLPLYAGGFEDGTGGVYQDDLPPAIAGPSGPGPAYHTGFSTNSSSTAGSRSEFGDDFSELGSNASTVGWSQAVDNGMSDHIDRRKVQSEDSFGTLSFEDLKLRPGSGDKVGPYSVTYSAASSETLDFEEIDNNYAKQQQGKGKSAQRNGAASESSFGTMEFSDAGDYDFNGKGKGKGIDRGYNGVAADSTTTLVNPPPSSTRAEHHGEDDIMDDNFFVNDGNDDNNDFEFSDDDSGDETEKEEDTVMV